MKKIFILIILISAGLLLANPIAPVIISELYFEGSDWTIELFDYYEFGLTNLDGCYIMSSSDSVYFNNGICFDPGEIILVTEADLQAPLSINKEGDFIYIVGVDFEDFAYFGNYQYSWINPPYDNQSLARVVLSGRSYFRELSFIFAKENQPSLGSNPFSVNTYGTLNGYVYDIHNNPVYNAEINYVPASDFSEFFSDENGYFENTQMYGMNYNVTVKINSVVYADTFITVEPDSTTFIEFYTNYDPLNIDDCQIQKVEYGLSNYPNPFNPSTAITFFTAEDAVNAEFFIYNSKGQKVDELSIPNPSSTGQVFQSSITWEADNFPSGVYLYKLIVDGKELAANKMLLLK